MKINLNNPVERSNYNITSELWALLKDNDLEIFYNEEDDTYSVYGKTSPYESFKNEGYERCNMGLEEIIAELKEDF